VDERWITCGAAVHDLAKRLGKNRERLGESAVDKSVDAPDISLWIVGVFPLKFA
jgi:hypothetical protein